MKDLTLAQIAAVIRLNWKNVYFGAVPYLDAMSTMNHISENYGCDTGSSVVAYLLSNMTSFRGECAREVKKELNSRLKASYK